MEIRDVRYVLAIEKTKNISKAADELYISQPALSKYLRNLESRLGMPLFDRSGNQWILTKAGKVYIDCAIQIESLHHEMVEKLQALKNEENSILLIGANLATKLHIPEITIDVKQKYPNCDLRITESFSKQIEQNVLKGALDGAILGEPYHSDLEYIHLKKEYLLLALPSSHPLVRKGVPDDNLPYPWFDINMLQNEQFILQDDNCRIRQHIDHVLTEAGVHVNLIITAYSTVMAIQFIEQGLGGCFFTESFISFVNKPDSLRLFCIGKPAVKYNFGFAYKKGKNLSKLCEVFIDSFKKYNLSDVSLKPKCYC
jgi:DNA-binding transcriptional LysR family regulator